MTVIVTSFYNKLMKGFAWFFNKYWGPEQEVIVLSYDHISGLPSNFNVQLLPPEEKQYWTNGLINFFKNFEDNYFILFLDDYFLSKPINTEVIKQCENKIKDADKIELRETVGSQFYKDYDMNFYKRIHNSPYKVSLQVGVWTKQFFTSHLIPGRSIWDFEIKGSKEIDNSRVILRAKDGIDYGNILVKGRLNPKGINKFVGQDKIFLENELSRIGYGTLSNCKERN